MTAPAPQRLLADLNPAQRRAVEHAAGPLCIFAGAGTGKTRTITSRIAYQVVTGAAAPGQILAVTFTDKAAGEMRQRLAALGLASPVRAATFHAAAWAQLRHFWPRVSEAPLPEVLPSKIRLLIPLARRTRTQAQDLAAEIEWAKARGLDPDGYAAAARGRDAPLDPTPMAEVFARYESQKMTDNLIDYEDMLLRATAAVTDDPTIAGEVRDRYRFFTVDEFQDINPAQFALLRAWLGGRDEVCVVGDDDQTIYSFTGASSSYLIDFTRHFPGAAVVTLEDNYRSTPQILRLANGVLWTKPAPLRKQLRATAAAGPTPRFVGYADDDAERKGLVDDIRELLSEGVAPAQIAVAYRVNSQSELLEETLRDADIPYVVRGDGGFFQRREIRQAIRMLADAAGRPAPPPPLGLEHTTAATPPRADDDVRRVLREQMAFNERTEPDGQAARDRWRNLATLVEVATRTVDAEPELTLAQLVEDLQARARAGDDSADGAGAVSLLTLHKAKGLEFDAVFLVAVEEGLLPISHAKTDTAVEEERRLLYVGVTRARRHLTLSWAARRPGYSGKVSPRRPSRFLYNLGPGAPTKGATTAKTSPSTNAKRAKASAPLAAPDGTPADPAVAMRLREWRRQRATDDGVPAFVVFNDRTLAELAAKQPTSRAQLLQIGGIGPTKVDRYGDDVLRVLGGA